MNAPHPAEKALMSRVPLSALAQVARAVRDGRVMPEDELRRVMPDLTPAERQVVIQCLARYKDD